MCIKVGGIKMDVVTIAVAIAVGATLASLSSVLLNIIKDVLNGKSNEAQVIIKKDGRTIEILNLTNEEIDRLLLDFKQGYQGHTPQEALK